MSKLADDLRSQFSALRAAVEACLKSPEREPVHSLRTTTRRIQALLEILPLLPGLSAISSQAKPFLKAVEPIRRAAGKVRDLDVYLDSLTELPNTSTYRSGVARMVKLFEHKRDRRGAKLQRLLRKRQAKLLSTLNDLELHLRSIKDFQLNPEEADHLARHWFAESAGTLNPTDPEQLHQIRKAAKLARYVAEAAIGKRSPTARHFNKIQQITGTWHDWYALTGVARKHLDPASRLLALLEQHRSRAHHAALTLVAKHRTASDA